MHEKIKVKQLELLYSHLPVSVLTAFFSVSFVSYVFWGNVSPSHYIAWVVCFILITVYRFSILILYRNLGIDKLSLNIWDHLNFAGTFLTGLVWGLLTLFYSDEWPTELSVCLWVALVALMSGASSSFSVVIRYFLAYSLPILLLSVYTQIMTDNYYITVVYLFFVALLTMTSFNFHEKQNNIILHEIDLEESNLQLQSLASEDSLTNLPNRRAFDKYFHEEWGRHVRSKKNLSLMMIDVDYFKNYNDNYGHHEGDQRLKDIARVLEQSLHRSSDMVARYGGEEFVIILPETPRDGAAAVAGRIHEILSDKNILHEFSNISKQLTVSVGIAEMIPKVGQDSKILQLLADKELYKAKANGRNCTSCNQEDK